MATVLFSLGLLYFFAHALALTFGRTRVPDVLVLMVSGIIMGPVLGIVNVATFGQVGSVITTVALAVILFQSGTTLDLASVVRSAGATTKLTMTTCGMSIVIIALIGAFVGGLAWIPAFTLGTILCGTSSAVVIPMVSSLSLGGEAKTVMILESALTDVLCIVLTFALVHAGTEGNVNVMRVVGQTLSALVFAAIIGVGGGVVWLRVWNWIRRLPTTTFSTVAWAFMLYGIAELLGFSGAIAVLSFGLSLRNFGALRLDRLFRGTSFTGVTDVEQSFFGEIVFLLKTFFFVYLGISMQRDSLRSAGLALAAIAAAYVSRLVIARTSLPSTFSRRDASTVAVMVPKGLAAAVLAGIPLSAGMAGGAEIQTVTNAVVFGSVTLTALLIAVQSSPTGTRIERALFARFPEA